MADKVRYGVMGVARIARSAHLPAANEAKHTEIVAVASRTADKAQACADKFGIEKACGSYEDLLADENVDAIINPLPNRLHCEWTVKAAAAGKHVFCEKPLAATVEEADRMISACESAGVKLMEAFKIRFMPQQDYVREQIDAGVIGDVKIVRCELTYTLPDWDTDVRGQADLAGGALFDAGCYCVNQARAIMGDEPVAVQAFQRLHERNRVDATFVSVLKFPGDRMAYVTTGMEQPFFHRCEIVGTTGRIEIPNMFGPEIVRVFAGKEPHTEQFPQRNPHVAMLEHFSDCVLNDNPVSLTPADSRANTAVLVALKRAAETEQTVRLDR
jgi:predicted dehydrogenase